MITALKKKWNPQAIAVHAYLSGYVLETGGSLRVTDWENGRERGFALVVTRRDKTLPQLIFLVYEHRSCDDICVTRFTREKYPYRAGEKVTLDNLPSDLFKNDAWLAATSNFKYGQAAKAADFIVTSIETANTGELISAYGAAVGSTPAAR